MKKSLIITEQQAKGILERTRMIEVAQNTLNQFVAAVVAGHGYDGQIQVTGVDTDKLLLHIEEPEPEKAAKKKGVAQV